MMTFSNAITTYVGQNVGAGRWDRVKSGIHATLKLSVGLSLVICVLLLLFSGTLLELFTTSPAVIEAGQSIWSLWFRSISCSRSCLS